MGLPLASEAGGATAFDFEKQAQASDDQPAKQASQLALLLRKKTRHDTTPGLRKIKPTNQSSKTNVTFIMTRYSLILPSSPHSTFWL